MLEKSRENKCRRKLEKMGYWLRKSRTRNTHYYDKGGYAIWEPYIGYIVWGEHWDLSLNEVEDYVNQHFFRLITNMYFYGGEVKNEETF